MMRRETNNVLMLTTKVPHTGYGRELRKFSRRYANAHVPWSYSFEVSHLQSTPNDRWSSVLPAGPSVLPVLPLTHGFLSTLGTAGRTLDFTIEIRVSCRCGAKKNLFNLDN